MKYTPLSAIPLREHTYKITKKFTQDRVQFLLIFCLIFQRYLFFGFSYFPQLDDFIQHHNSAFVTFDFQVNQLGLFSVRPLAGLLDVTLWVSMFDVMILGVFLITLLYTSSAMIFYRLLGRFFPCSPLFLVIYTLIPLGFEGTYWMSASTRIVPGLFFAALSAWGFDQFCREGNKKFFGLFFLAQTLCFGFYEQSMVLSLTLTGLLMLYHFFPNRQRSLYGFSFLGTLAIYFLVTTLAPSNDMYASRGQFIFPSPYYFNVFLPDLLGQLKSAFLGGGFYTLVKGFVRGFLLIIAERRWDFLAVTLALSGLVYFLPKIAPKKEDQWSQQEKIKKFQPILGFVVGFILFLAPISIFFVLSNPWFSLRGTVTSFCGIALMIDSLCTFIFQKIPPRYPLQVGIAMALAFGSVVASVSELADYRDTYYDDYQVAATLYPHMSSMKTGEKVAVLGLEGSYLEDQNFLYHEHVHGVTQSDWAMSGRMTEYRGEPGASVTPLSVLNPAYYSYHGEGYRPDNFDALFYYDHQKVRATPLTLKVISEEYYEFYDRLGNLFAVLEETEGMGVITLISS